MNNLEFSYLIYQKDFTDRGGDRYFIFEKNVFKEVSSEYIVNITSLIVTHDYWLIASSLFSKHKKLPKNVADINLLSRILIGKKASESDPQLWDISKTIKPIYKNHSDFDEYINIFYRRSELNHEIYMLFSHKLAEVFEKLLNLSNGYGEYERFFNLELPVFNLLMFVSNKGLRVSNEILKMHKTQIKADYYKMIKCFAEKHNVMYEIPIKGDIRDKLSDLGYDVDKYTTDFLIDFLPSIDDYTEDLRGLQKLNKSYRVFNNISTKTKRLKPIAETHSTSSSRVYFKSPNIQNISKKYRDIFIPDDELQLSYIDYDQFEVGIMAALSNDEKMKDIYTNKDAYIDLSNIVFGSDESRKRSKILFLSYTYGMSMDNILGSIDKLGGNVKKAKSYFDGFETFEKWKQSLYEIYERDSRIGTVFANFLNRSIDGDLTNKEKRSLVSHVVQGTGSYIFKLAMLELSNEADVEILIPMHDAILIQHPESYDPNNAVKIFENTMTNVLSNKLKGKASIEPFYTAT